MRHLRALLITTALAATACSGGSESVTDAEPDATSAPASSAPTTEAPSETEDVPWEQGQEVALVPAGTVRLPFMGGVQFELEQDRVVVQAPPSIANIHHQGDQIDEPKVILIVANETSDGEPITTVEELATALTEHVGVELTPIGEVATGIGPAQGFESTASEFDPTLSKEEKFQLPHLLATDVGWAWLPSPFGQVWIVDTDQGPLLISAQAPERGPLLDELIATLELLLETIEIADLD
jgi:hypothetical protein